MPLCLVVNFGSESEDVVVKEVLFKGQRIVENKSSKKGGFAWEVNNKYYTCRYVMFCAKYAYEDYIQSCAENYASLYG